MKIENTLQKMLNSSNLTFQKLQQPDLEFFPNIVIWSTLKISQTEYLEEAKEIISSMT
jgi:hypothetical protein